jgi:hypothetical protein
MLCSLLQREYDLPGLSTSMKSLLRVILTCPEKAGAQVLIRVVHVRREFDSWSSLVRCQCALKKRRIIPEKGESLD